MYSYLKGNIIDCSDDKLILDVNDIGYELSISAKDSAIFIDMENEDKIIVHTHLQVKEDSHTLYGFFTKQAKKFFLILKNINGVGPKTALSVLSTLNGEDIVKAVMENDVLKITAVPGIGKKTAERIILELKDKLDKLPFAVNDNYIAPTKFKINSEQEAEVSEALRSLGYSAGEANRMLQAVAPQIQESASIEKIITLALKQRDLF